MRVKAWITHRIRSHRKIIETFIPLLVSNKNKTVKVAACPGVLCTRRNDIVARIIIQATFS